MYKFLIDCYFKESIWHSAESPHIREYLREIETKLENILGH
jgi:hypothetical protein